MEAGGFKQIHRAERIHFEIKNWDVACFVVRGLSRTMNDKIEAIRTEERFEGGAVANVYIIVIEVLSDLA